MQSRRPAGLVARRAETGPAPHAARRFEFEIEAGMVGINVPIPVPMAYYSFGGWNDSLFGDTHVHGPEGVHFYTRGKVVTTRWADPVTRGPDLGFPTHT